MVGHSPCRCLARCLPELSHAAPQLLDGGQAAGQRRVVMLQQRQAALQAGRKTGVS